MPDNVVLERENHAEGNFLALLARSSLSSSPGAGSAGTARTWRRTLRRRPSAGGSGSSSGRRTSRRTSRGTASPGRKQGHFKIMSSCGDFLKFSRDTPITVDQFQFHAILTNYRSKSYIVSDSDPQAGGPILCL